jgi:Asp-tRNA(Asn)/Glu-tRNA(Gln) amidotransferase A subunit family amidase
MLDPYIEACELRNLIAKGDLSVGEVAEFFLDRVEKLNPALGAFITISANRVARDVARLGKLRPNLELTPLFGIPYSLKDLTWTVDMPTTFGSRNFAGFFAPADAEIARRLERAGGVLLGKTNTPEFGGRPTTEGGLGPIARNPWKLEFNAGGSSGGAAAAACAGMGLLHEGTDGGGSIRGPASHCGVVGLKPSRGRISWAPARGEAWGGFATRGPMARTVRDVALMLDVIAGPVLGDPYWAPPPPMSFIESIKSVPRKARIAVIGETSLSPVDADVAREFEIGCSLLQLLGHSVEKLKLDPGAMLLESARKLICVGVAATPLTNPQWVDPVVCEMIRHGSAVSAGDYVNLLAEMHNIARAIVQALDPYDFILTPTATRPAARNGAFPSAPTRYLDELWTWIAFQYPFNATGQPAISVPNGFSDAGLPVGLQIVGRPNDDSGVLALAAQFEEARPWKHLRPPID